MILQMADPVKELKEIRFTSEKEMQHFCEKNMEQMLGLQFIASEFRVAQFRFDSVAYNPVSTAFNIIEYKNDKNFSVVDQGYSYISTLLQHKADFVLRYNQIFNINKRLEDFDWTQVRVLFIAPSYTVHQLNSINFNDLPMQLWRIKRYERGIIQFEQIKPTSTVASISGYSSMPANSVATKVTSAIGSAKAMEDAAITELIAKQKAAGYHVITDGEFRRSTWHLDFMWGFEGVGHKATERGLQFQGEAAKIDDTFLTGKISLKEHPFVCKYK